MTRISFLLLLPFLLLIIQIGFSKSDDIAVYWGQDSKEGSLTGTCATGIYSFVVIASLSCIWSETPHLNLADHFDPGYITLAHIGREIKYCQRQGIKVMLSLRGACPKKHFLGGHSVSFSSEEAQAQNLSDYLWNNFLGGSSSSRPFVDAILDGIDFDIAESRPHLDDLARSIKSYSTDSQKVHLSAAPQCSYPDAYFRAAFDTGLFDYFWVKFFNNPSCCYSEANSNAFVISWNQWTTSLNRSKIFLGLPASQVAALSGYVPADLLISKVLPTVKKSPNYGGVMLWSRYQDRSSGYSTHLQLGLPCTRQSAPKCRNNESYFGGLSGYMSTDSIKVDQSEKLVWLCCETICWNNCSCEAYAAVNQVNKTGCQIWLKGTRFTEGGGSKGQPIFIVRHKNIAKHKGMNCFLTRKAIILCFCFFIYQELLWNLDNITCSFKLTLRNNGNLHHISFLGSFLLFG